ncbi:MAG: arginine deiminase family protein [candidate division KSB1 bacterium]|nr:arginine deiminase family protein [candidate division KSB1 bacterium]MDZ7366650.1 arginine deiminase family protein [candidate division KSB1 bacterium]MDZ7404661.1 arginine deiminase family protein [candidate division KSB1 bacterium]
MPFGSQSEVGKIQRLLLKHAQQAFISKENILRQWEALNYLSAPDFDKALQEYEQFVNLLRQHIPEISFLPANDHTGLDSIYVHDAALVTNQGAILCNMGKALRRGEPAAIADFLPELGVPILAAITGEGRLEGGDVVWIDAHTLAVGRGYRTNDEGIRQLKELTADLVDEVIVVSLPHWQGPNDVLHLMSLISPIDHDLALVYSKLLPVPFRQWLLARGIKLLEVPDSEYDSMGCNVLAIAPRKCLMLAGNPRTQALLINEGVEVWEYVGEEISRKGAGGPTCLTRPIWRDR